MRALKEKYSFYQKLFFKSFVKDRRIYIFPTKIGLYYCGGIFICFLLAMTYGNSLAYTVSFLFFSFLICVCFSTNFSLKDIDVDFSDDQVLIYGYDESGKLILGNHAKENRYSLEFDIKDLYIEPLELLEADSLKKIKFKPRKWERQVLKIDRIKVYTDFPFSLFRAWFYVRLANRLYVLNEPVKDDQFDLVEKESLKGKQIQGGDQFSHLREYQGDNLSSRLDWKRYSHNEKLYVKEFSKNLAPKKDLQLDKLSGNIEEKLQKLTYQIIEMSKVDQEFSVTFGRKTFGPGKGEDFKKRCLIEVARYKGDI